MKGVSFTTDYTDSYRLFLLKINSLSFHLS